jgi:hypothetical protein
MRTTHNKMMIRLLDSLSCSFPRDFLDSSITMWDVISKV